MLFEIWLEAIPSGVELKRDIGQASGRDLERLRELGSALMPGVEHILAGRHLRKYEGPVTLGLREMGAVPYHDQRAHLRVHVTVHPDDAGSGEPNRAVFAPPVQTEVEWLLFGQRKDVVVERVVVGE